MTDYEELTDKFVSSARSGVSLESGMVAVLSPTCLLVPIPELDFISYFIGILLLIIVLLRRMILINKTREQAELMRKSSLILESALILSLISIFVSFYHRFAVDSLFLDMWILALLVTISMFGIILFQEIAFHDYLLWWNFRFIKELESLKESEIEWQMLTELLSFCAVITYKFSKPLQGLTPSQKYRDAHRTHLGPDLLKYERYNLSQKQLLKQALKGFLLVLIIALPIMILSTIFFGWSGIMIVMSIFMVRDNVRFLGCAYGNMHFKDLKLKLRWRYAIFTGYVISLYLFIHLA